MSIGDGESWLNGTGASMEAVFSDVGDSVGTPEPPSLELPPPVESGSAVVVESVEDAELDASDEQADEQADVEVAESDVEPDADVEPEAKPEPWVAVVETLRINQEKFMTAVMDRLAPKEPEPEPEPERPFSVSGEFHEFLRSKGVDPDSTDGQEYTLAYALDQAKGHFAEADQAKIVERLARLDARGERDSSRAKSRKRIDELESKIEGLQSGRERDSIISTVANSLNDPSMVSEYPLASRAQSHGVRVWLDQTLGNGKVTDEALVESISGLDDFLASMGLRSQDDVTRYYKFLSGQKKPDWRAAVLHGFKVDAVESKSEKPRASLTQKKAARPNPPKGVEAGGIKAPSTAEGWLSADSATAVEKYSKGVNERADARFFAQEAHTRN